jgi:hypothetical protein
MGAWVASAGRGQARFGQRAQQLRRENPASLPAVFGCRKIHLGHAYAVHAEAGVLALRVLQSAHKQAGARQ